MYVWETPRYSTTEAGRIVGLSPGRVRRWLQGYRFPLDDKIVEKGPVVTRRSDSKYASFLDLMDLLFVKKFIDEGFSLQKIRASLSEARSIVGGHHFAQRSFMSDGRNIYLRVKQRDSTNLLQLFSGGQWVIKEFIIRLAKQIDFDQTTGFAERWYPAGREGRVVLDPRFSFGAPVVVGKGIRTSNVYDLFLGEKENLAAAAKWLDITVGDVKAAVDFEQSIAA